MAESKTGSATAINSSYTTTTNHPNEEKIRKSRELFAQRLNEIRKREEDEQQRKLRELHEQLLAAEKLQQLKLEERKRRLRENRSRENDRRLQVIDRKQKLLEAELERKEAILRRNLEREQRIELLKKKRASCHVLGNGSGGGGGGGGGGRVFAFGSSTPRHLLEPSTTLAFPPQPHYDYTAAVLFEHHHRRSTSSNNMYMSAYSTLSNNKMNIGNTSAKNRSPNRSSHNLSLNTRSMAMSSSMYEVFNWNDEDFNQNKKNNNRNNISTNSINRIGNDTNNNLNQTTTTATAGTTAMDENRNHSNYFRVIRRRTDLIPTIPLSKLNSASTQALGSSSATSRSSSSMSQSANQTKWQKQNRPRSIAISGLTRSQILTAPETANAKVVTGLSTKKKPESKCSPSPLLLSPSSSSSQPSSQSLSSLVAINRKILANTEEEAKLVISERRRRIREEEQQRRKLQTEQTEQVLPLADSKTDVTEPIETSTTATVTTKVDDDDDDDDDGQENVAIESEPKAKDIEREMTERYNREQAEKLRIELAEKLEREEHERELRRKRVEAIMLRTRNGTPSTKNGISSLDSAPSSTATTATAPAAASSAPASFSAASDISPSSPAKDEQECENLNPEKETIVIEPVTASGNENGFHMHEKQVEAPVAPATAVAVEEEEEEEEERDEDVNDDDNSFLKYLKRPRNDSKCDNVNNSGSNGDYNSYQNLNLIT